MKPFFPEVTPHCTANVNELKRIKKKSNAEQQKKLKIKT